MTDHEDYIKLSEKIDGLCANTRDNFERHIGKVHDRVDIIHDQQIRHDERIKIMEAREIDEVKRWKIVQRALIILALLHVLEFSQNFPQIIALMKTIGF